MWHGAQNLESLVSFVNRAVWQHTNQIVLTTAVRVQSLQCSKVQTIRSAVCRSATYGTVQRCALRGSKRDAHRLPSAAPEGARAWHTLPRTLHRISWKTESQFSPLVLDHNGEWEKVSERRPWSPRGAFVICWISSAIMCRVSRSDMYSAVAYRGGVWGVQPPRNSEGPPKSCQTQPELWKLLKIAEFRTPTHQDVRKKRQ